MKKSEYFPAIKIDKCPKCETPLVPLKDKIKYIEAMCPYADCDMKLFKIYGVTMRKPEVQQ